MSRLVPGGTDRLEPLRSIRSLGGQPASSSFTGKALVFVGLLLAAPTTAGLVFTNLIAFRLGDVPVLGPPLIPWLPWLLWIPGVLVVLGFTVYLARIPRLRPLALLPLPLLAGYVALLFGPLYPPFRGLHWLLPLLRHPPTRGLAGQGLLWGATTFLLLVALGGTLRRLDRPRVDVADIAHGSARLATTADLRQAGMLSGRGTYLGGWEVHGRRVPLTDASEEHVLLMMPSGAGKTTGTILSTLLTATGESAFILDPKRELWRQSAGYRQAAGHKCLCFAPTSPTSSLRWNCLDEIEKGPRELAGLRVLADNLVTFPASAAGGQDHWVQSARSLFRLLALHVLYADTEASIPRVRALLNDPRSTHEKLFRTLLAYKHDRRGLRGFRDPSTGKPTATHPEVALLAHAFLETPPKERGSIVSTLQGFLGLWGDEVVAGNSSASDFSVRDFLGPRPISLYVALPYGDLASLAPLLRVLLALLTRALTDEEAFPGTGSSRRRRIHFFLDEFASLGRVPILEEMLAFFRGYGVRAHVVVQDLNQIRRNYSDRESITGNCQIHVSAATQSAATRAHVSGLAGDTTVRYERRSQSGGKGGFLMDRTSIMPVEARRPLLTQGEAGSLPKERLVILKTGLPPILAWKYPFFRDRELARRAAYPPPAPPVPPIQAPPPAPPPLETLPQVEEPDEPAVPREASPAPGADDLPAPDAEPSPGEEPPR